MAEDLLDEIKDPGKESAGETSGVWSGIKAFLKKISGSKKRWVLILVSVLVLLCAGTGIVFFLLSGPAKEKTEPEPAMSEPAAEKQEFQDIVTFGAFERLALKSGSNKGFISLGLSLELMDRRFQMQVYSMEDRIRRMVQNQVRERTWLELRSPEGKIRLKYALLQGINELFPKAMVRNLYFTDFIMQ